MSKSAEDLGDIHEIESYAKSGNYILNNNSSIMAAMEIEEMIKHFLSKSSPSDSIYLTRDDDWRLMTLWEGIKKDGEKFTIPSDLIFSANIPLTDFIVHIDERKYGGVETSARFCIFDFYTKIVDNPPNIEWNLPLPIGCIILYTLLPEPIVIPIIVKYGFDSIITMSCAFFEDSLMSVSGRYPHITHEILTNAVFCWLETWYGIQIAMLHPQIKNCFRIKGKEKIKKTGVDKNGKPTKRTTAYIKRKYLADTDFAEETDDHKYVRKCLAWYVCGHWRHYKTGKMQFIQGYWKGVLRDTKKNHDEGRDRIIIEHEKISKEDVK